MPVYVCQCMLLDSLVLHALLLNTKPFVLS
jgi:hypothetical protein